MDERITQVDSTLHLEYDEKFPYHLAVIHDNGKVFEKKPLSKEKGEKSIYFHEHDGQSILQVLHLMVREGILPKGTEVKDNDSAFTGKSDTREAIWFEHYDKEALAALDGYQQNFTFKNIEELRDGEWEWVNSTVYLHAEL